MTEFPLYDTDGVQIGTAKLSHQELDYIAHGGRLVRLYLRTEIKAGYPRRDVPATETVPVIHATAFPYYENSAYVGSRLVVEFIADQETAKTLKGEWWA
jgi:hypothetical protein